MLRHVLVPARSHILSITPGSVLVFSPHQDDETLGCGGLIARKRLIGAPVTVVFLTDGSRSHGDLPLLERERLVATRRNEAQAALDILGVPAGNIHFLGFPDGELSSLPASGRAALSAQLSDLLVNASPAEVFVPHRRDSHPDHEATFTLVRDIVSSAGQRISLYEYPIWLFWSRNRLFGNLRWSDLAGAYRLPLDPDTLARKRRAMAEHRTQLETLPSGFAEHLLAPREELFFRTA